MEWTFSQPRLRAFSLRAVLSLSCNYTGTAGMDSLLWYRQYPHSEPEFLYLLRETNFRQEADPPVPGLSVQISSEQNHVSLHLSSAQLTDSALYYCALQPTVLGGAWHTCTKTSMWSETCNFVSFMVSSVLRDLLFGSSFDWHYIMSWQFAIGYKKNIIWS